MRGSLKVDVGTDENSVETEPIDTPCDVEARLKKMEDFQIELVNRIAELRNELNMERDARKAVEERLQAAEEKLNRAAITNENGSGDETPAPSETGPEVPTKDIECVKHAGRRVTDSDAAAKGEQERRGQCPVSNPNHADKEDKGKHGETSSEGESEKVIIAGDSNLSRCSAAIVERVKGDKRVAVGTFPGRTLADVMERAREKLAENAQARNLVIVSGGLNDVLSRKGAGIAQRLAKGVDNLREVSPRVQIVVCTVPVVPVRDINVQRAVAATNEAIWQMSREKGFEVVEVNREVRRYGGFQKDGIHFDHRLGREVGWRLAGRAVAFLGGPRALRRPG